MPHSGRHTTTYLSLSVHQETGVEFDYVLHEHSLDVSGEGSHFWVEESVQRGTGVREVARELPHNPGSCVEDLTNAFLADVPSEEVCVLQNSGLEVGL